VAEPPSLLQAKWARLRQATPARIGLARTGAALATAEHLAFQLAQARARDAVHEALDPAALLDGLRARGFEAVALASAAPDRATYLARPDLGRQLDAVSRAQLDGAAQGFDLVFVLADGLSAGAVARHALPLLDAMLPELRRLSWAIGPVAAVTQGRVAIGDEIGQALGASLAAVLIGERPGLSSPDSLGLYVTYAPAPGRLDAERNCLSNIRPEGMGYDEAARRFLHLATEARRRGCTGIALKDETLLPGLGPHLGLP
jgi:ethanolamine ammonia-lyase small subunit